MKKKLAKRLLKSPSTHFLLSLTISLLMRLIYLSCRIKRVVAAQSQPLLDGTQPAIFCFWHGRMAMHPFAKPPGRSMQVMMSHHSDGAIAASVMRWFGIGSVRASKRLGTMKALRDILAITERGGNICITPDGPRGPHQKAAHGAPYIAAKTGYPILATSFSATRHWRFKSWDRFMLPKPFSTITYVIAPPIFAAGESDAMLQETMLLLERELNRITAEADLLSGVAA